MPVVRERKPRRTGSVAVIDSGKGKRSVYARKCECCGAEFWGSVDGRVCRQPICRMEMARRAGAIRSTSLPNSPYWSDAVKAYAEHLKGCARQGLEIRPGDLAALLSWCQDYIEVQKAKEYAVAEKTVEYVPSYYATSVPTQWNFTTVSDDA